MTARILIGDVFDQIEHVETKSIHTIITSPPYFGLRDYEVDGQIGLEGDLNEYITKIIQVGHRLWRVLRDDGTLWLNLGDSYGKHKSLMGMPWRTALALQSVGWYLRADIIWAKPNPMPESVLDRPTRSHEHLFLLTKRPQYYYDHVAIQEPSVTGDQRRPYTSEGANREGRDMQAVGVGEMRNKRDVWTITPRPYKEAHFATFPPKLVEPCILAGTSERGVCPACGAPWARVTERTAMVIDRSERTHSKGRTRSSGTMVAPPTVTTLDWEPTCACAAGDPIPATVLDPFVGSGTTLMVAEKLGRDSIGIELNPSYKRLIQKRLKEGK
jgi:DNA modification methylase